MFEEFHVILPDVMKSDKEEKRNVMKRIHGRIICQEYTEAFRCSWLVKGNEMFPFALRSQLQGIFKCTEMQIQRSALPHAVFILASNLELNTMVTRVQGCTTV
jgi:hypothetical protein